MGRDIDRKMKENENLPYDPADRAAEKQRSRDEDARALASGAKSRDQLRRENAFLDPHGGQINFDAAGPDSLW